MNDTAAPPARVPLDQLVQAGAGRITAELHRALPEAPQPASGGFNSAI